MLYTGKVQKKYDKKGDNTNDTSEKRKYIHIKCTQQMTSKNLTDRKASIKYIIYAITKTINTFPRMMSL